jgi:hypothetical protein
MQRPTDLLLADLRSELAGSANAGSVFVDVNALVDNVLLRHPAYAGERCTIESLIVRLADEFHLPLSFAKRGA